MKLSASKKHRPRSASAHMLGAHSGPSAWKLWLPARHAGKAEAGRRQPPACPARLGWEMVLLCLSCWGDEGELGFSRRRGCFGASACPAFLLSPPFWGERIPSVLPCPWLCTMSCSAAFAPLRGSKGLGENPRGAGEHPHLGGQDGLGGQPGDPHPHRTRGCPTAPAKRPDPPPPPTAG